jgi:hypothetical protein
MLPFWSPDRVGDLSSGQYLPYVRTQAGFIERTVTLNRSDTRDQSASFRGSARPDVIKTPFGRGPHRGYKNPLLTALSTIPHKFYFWLIVSKLFVSSWLSFCIFLSHSKYFSVMLKFFGLNCDILCLYFYKSPFFTTVILSNFCYPNKNIFFCGLFLAKILVGSFAESCLPLAPSAGSARDQWKSRVRSKPKLWTAMSSLSGTWSVLISRCLRWIVSMTLSRPIIGGISILVPALSSPG